MSPEDEDRFIADAAHENGGWPFGDDATRDDPLTALRIAVTTAHPKWAYLVAFDRASPQRPTDVEAAMLASFREEYIGRWFSASYAARLARRPLDVDGATNTPVFHKYGPDDWGYGRRSWDGPLFVPQPPDMREWERSRGHTVPGPMSLTQLLDYMRGGRDGDIDPRWIAWKAMHPEVFGAVAR